MARLRADQKKHYVLLINWSVGAVRRRADAAAAIERAGGRVAPVIYTHRADYRLALEHGQGVTEFQPGQAAAKEMRDVWQWLRAEVGLKAKRRAAAG